MAARTSLFSRIFGGGTIKRSVWPEHGPRRWRDDRGWTNAWNQTVPANLIVLSQRKHATDPYFRNGIEARVTALAGPGWKVVPKIAAMRTEWETFSATMMWGGGSFELAVMQAVRSKEVTGEGVMLHQPDGKWLTVSHDRLPRDYHVDLGPEHVIRENIEFRDGREIAAHFQLNDGEPLTRIESEDYIRCYRQEMPGQVRGIPSGASVLTATDTLADAEHALLEGIKVSAMFAGIATNANDMSAALPFDGEQRGGVLESGLEPGTLKILPFGWDVKFATPQQAQQSAEFLRHQLHRISAGLGVPTHLLSNDLNGANYSSLRAGMTEFNARIEAEQFAVIVPKLLRPLWDAFALRQYLAGKVDDLEAAKQCEFIAPARPWVDPEKDAKATEAMLRMGLTSRRRAIAELGWNVEDIDSEIARDQFRAQEPTTGLSTEKKEATNAKA
jgi:lambda family phage portal protein